MSQTPYDAGTVLEPHPWAVQWPSGSWVVGAGQRPAEPDDFGRVDFDDSEGATVLVVHVKQERTAGGAPFLRVAISDLANHAIVVEVDDVRVAQVEAL